MILLYDTLAIFLFIFLLLFTLLLIVKMFGSFVTSAPFISLPKAKRDMLIDSFNFGPNSVFFDLGCGNGQILIKAVEKNPTLKAVGVELDLIPYFLAKFNTRNYKNIEIRRGNFLKTDLSEATHIFIYLFPKITDTLLGKMQKECRPGTNVISCDFPFTKIEPIKVIDLTSVGTKQTLGKKLFVYSI